MDKIEILIPEIDTGKSKITLFNVNGVIVEKKYNYGNGYGFLFLTKYPSIENYENKLTRLGSERIYSSTNDSECTQEGREIEFKLFKFKKP